VRQAAALRARGMALRNSFLAEKARFLSKNELRLCADATHL
jgi:hypothetical protein